MSINKSQYLFGETPMQVSQNGQIKVEEILDFTLRLKKILNRFSIKLLHYHTLLLLRRYPGITPKKIVKEFSILPAMVSRLMNYLEEEQLIERKIGGDRRTINSYLTGKGVALLNILDEQIPSFQGKK